MRVYRSKQNWVPRKLFSLEPGKLVLCICNDQQLACYPSLPRCHPNSPPTPQENGSKKYFKSQAENWKMSCLSVWIKVCVSVSLVFFDNIAQVFQSCKLLNIKIHCNETNIKALMDIILFSCFHILQGIQKSKRNVLNPFTAKLYNQTLEMIYGL